MTRNVLLDANMLIAMFDGDKDSEVEKQRRQRVEELSNDQDVKLFITPLIYYEALRDVRRITPAEMEAELNAFDQIEIRKAHGRRAAELYQLAKTTGKEKAEWLDRRRFDVFHYVCAEIDGLELVAEDGDIPKIDKLITSRQSPKCPNAQTSTPY